MKAVDLLETSEVPENTVLEVYRRGYEWNGEVFRVAEVKVARAPRGPLAEKRHEP
jgi:molecular chaperone GrpE